MEQEVTQELLPCPFCGSDELSHGYVNYGGALTIGNVECHSCDVVVTANTEAEAITAWNTRLASTEALRAEIAERDAEVARLRGLLGDLVSWFPDEAPKPEYRIEAGDHGATDAVEAARAEFPEDQTDD